MRYRVLRKMLNGYEVVAEFMDQSDAFAFLELKLSDAANDIFEIKASDVREKAGISFSFSDLRLLHTQAKEDAAGLYCIEEIR